MTRTEVMILWFSFFNLLDFDCVFQNFLPYMEFGFELSILTIIYK